MPTQSTPHPGPSTKMAVITPRWTTPLSVLSRPRGSHGDNAEVYRRSPRPTRPGMVLSSTYRLHSKLGEGGIGEVWDAERTSDGRRVAVKLMRRALYRDPRRLARFLREGRLAGSLSHPNVVEILEVGGEYQPRPFLVMERLSGPSLFDRVEREGPLPWPRARRVLLQICSALAHAHEQQIVHHDVKPSNIVLAHAMDDRDRIKLVDFGIARCNGYESAVQLTLDGQVLGSPGYMSPEQLEGKRADPRSDLFGLGGTAFHLLTGRDPIEATSVTALVNATLYDPPPPLPDLGLGPARHQAVEELLHRALGKDPAGRFESATAMARAIAAIR